MKPMLRAVSCVVACLLASTAAAQPPLTVVNAGPQGSLDRLEQANEIRVVFSEPMVTLGRIPSKPQPAFFHIRPSVAGTFRWSGTTILIFTADPKSPLPFATTYEVTIDETAAAVSGRRLAKPFSFRFTTPVVRLLRTNWYRRGGTVDGPMVILLRFNQRVRPTDVTSALSASLQPHSWQPPAFTEEERARLARVDPQALGRFDEKVRATRAVASGRSAVPLRLTDDWDKKTYRPGPDLVVLETTAPLLPESWVQLTLAPTLRSPAGPATPGTAQEYTIQAEPAFFIDGFLCRHECDADRWNPIQMRAEVKAADFAASINAVELSGAERPVAKAEAPRSRRSFERDQSDRLSVEDAGFDAQPPDRTWAVQAPADLRAADGQTLGYTWLGIVRNWHMRAFTSFGDGHGVWEKDGGTLLPFYARNMRDVTQWAAPILPSRLMPTLQTFENGNFNKAPEGPGIERRLGGPADRVLSHGLDLSKALRPGNVGLVWAAVQEGEPIERARRFGEPGASRVRASVVQVTNLGITVKDSPSNTLVFVTRLDTGAPVPGAAVSIVRLDNSVFWRGTTGADGVAIAPETRLRDPDDWWKFAFVVMAEKDGDVAYVGSDWNEGIGPWDFRTGLNLREASPLLRGSVFTDRGVYRLGEEVHLKAILRHNTADGIRLLPPGTRVAVTVRDSRNQPMDERTIALTDWSSAEWTMTLPRDGALGDYSLRAVLEADRPRPKTAEERDRTAEPGPEDDEFVPYEKSVQASFLVAAYRRPDFRVDVTLAGASAAPVVAGDRLQGVISARYLFGAALGARPVSWRYAAARGYSAPQSVTAKYAPDRWVFVGSPRDEHERPWGEIGGADTTLGAAGQLTLPLETRREAGVPVVYTLEGDVEDLSRQHLANRATITVHPAPWYVGIRRPSYFLDQKEGLKTALVAVGLDGAAVAGVPIAVTLTEVQWTSVRRAEGNGFYTWDTQRKEIPAGTWTITSAAEPVPLSVPFKNGGYFVLEATGRGEDGRTAVTRTSFYVLGSGYTAWARYDHNRIQLEPEQRTYKPGDTARIMIQSPWEKATALVTTEREGIRSHRQFTLTSTQQSISVAITEQDIPNLFVSVLLVKGRTVPATTRSARSPQQASAGQAASPAVVDLEADASDPGKPAFRLGYVELKVEDASKRLSLTVSANQEEYRPATSARVRVEVKDPAGKGTASEVTLWAVDYGVLSLTAYQTPDILGSVYVRKALQVLNADSRQRVISRRVLTPKGETEGGGGGVEAGAGMLRKDFRVLAFWLGSVTTGPDGTSTVDVKLPESLTTYRIMAVAADRSSRFGSGETEVRTNKPVTLKPAFPRFMTPGDRGLFGAVVGSQLPSPGTAVVTIKSLDPAVLQFAGPLEQRAPIAAGGNVEVRFEAAARAVGRARVQMSVRVSGESDAFEDVVPVQVLVSPEAVAAYGEVSGKTTTATETLTVPDGVVAGYGGLNVEMASTAMVGLGEGARYLVEYPYGCAEQKASRALALLLAADLGDAFTLPGMKTAEMRPAVQQTLTELERFQCGSGGFAYWPGQCASVSPYLTAYILHVFKAAADLKYRVDAGVRNRAYEYLERKLASTPPVNEGWWPSYTAWQAFAVKVLAEGGRNQDSNLTRLFGSRDRMPVFALAYLLDAIIARGEATGPRVEDLRRRMANAILPEGGSAHVEELADPYLLWFWNSNVRSTAIVLNSIARARGPVPEADATVRGLVRWLMAVRKNGRWGNTQENAHAMEALVAYYRKYEAVVPDFAAVVRLAGRELGRAEFRGRTTESKAASVPMDEIRASAPAGASRPLTFAREGAGSLFYSARLRYAVDTPFPEGLDAGFRIERRYEPFAADGQRPAATSYQAGDLVRITLTFTLPKERRFVAVTDPLPAGFEAVESWFQTTARDLARRQDDQSNPDEAAGEDDWTSWWRRGGFDHVERHDDRIRLFAMRLSEGTHEFSYIARATTAGSFRTAPARAEEMYEPEVFGRTGTVSIEVRR